MRLVWLGVVAVGLAVPGVAHAQFRDWKASADLDIDAQYARGIELSDAEQREGEASFGLRLRGTAGKNPVQYGLGLGYRFGASHPGGFLYAVELLPIGAGLVFSDRLRLVVRGGAGFSGVTGRVPFAGDFPIEARLDLRLTGWLALGGFARVSWTTASEREDGTTAIDFGDELSAGARLRIGRHYDHGRGMRGNDGYYLAAFVNESLGSRFVGGAFGYAIDFAAGR